jgi:beta-lactamase superfamily II metal-dependent hydrolase
MATLHFLNVLEGDCNIIQHDSGRVSVVDVSNAYNAEDTPAEKRVKQEKEQIIKARNYVPFGKINFQQKENPDNPIDYLQKLEIRNIFRFIITHPDMDHLDGIRDLYSEFGITNTWDTDNNKELNQADFPSKFNPEDWAFYTALRNGKYDSTNRLTYYAGNSNSYFNEDNIKILCPTQELIKQANTGGNMHDLSYVLLFAPPKKGGGNWKIIFSGDSHDNSWDYIIKNHKEEVSNVDVLFAPHHGRDSNRSYEFLKTLKPKVTLFGNASSNHLAYNSYPKTRLTNNQAGYIVINTSEERILVLAKNKDFASYFKRKRDWGNTNYHSAYDAYDLFQLSA